MRINSNVYDIPTACNYLKNRHALRTCGSALTQRCSTVFYRHLVWGVNTAKFTVNVWDFGRL